MCAVLCRACPQNFSSTVTYTVSGKGLATRVYSVDILDADGKRPTGKNDTPDTPSTPDTPVVASAKITEFSILGVKAVSTMRREPFF